MRRLLFTILIVLGSNMYTHAQDAALPLGIDTKEIKHVKNDMLRTIVTYEVRKPTYKNKDATRYLEKAVKENPEDLVKIKKLLDAGASAFITYEMIDKKQYDLMDLMHKSNPKLIRYSQLIHYAARHGDTTTLDFLVARGASLDLCGCYYYTYKEMDGSLRCGTLDWNNDASMMYTPSDVALSYGDFSMVNYIMRKYGHRPTVDGWTNRIYCLLLWDKDGIEGIDEVINYFNGYYDNLENGIYVGNGKKRRDATTEVINHRRFEPRGNGYLQYRYILNYAIQKMGEYRKIGNNAKADKYFQLIKLMIDKGADINVETQYPSENSWGSMRNITYDTPIFTAMQAPNMLDVIKYLKEKGAKMTVRFYNGRDVNTIPIKSASIRDEYKEALLIGEL